MTRDEQIEEAANKIYKPLHPSWAGSENAAFQSGAEWADAHAMESDVYKTELINAQAELKTLRMILSAARGFIKYCAGLGMTDAKDWLSRHGGAE